MSRGDPTVCEKAIGGAGLWRKIRSSFWGVMSFKHREKTSKWRGRVGK